MKFFQEQKVRGRLLVEDTKNQSSKCRRRKIRIACDSSNLRCDAFSHFAKRTVWADVMSLGPPDGQFMVEMNKALKTIAERKSEKTVIIRMMFGNIIGMPVNCTKVIQKLTEGVPADANLQLWVGAWRKKVSWNHAKIIAVDGIYLHTGGHNMWDPHYLRKR